MSLANFEDFYEICYCIMREEMMIAEMKQHEEKIRKTEDHRGWWEQAVEEIKKERELFYV